ncbi:Zinc finger RING-type [Trinorchestia longiramus]|nr:Zinc finger RING-type [Trinorchestia longiramus]
MDIDALCSICLDNPNEEAVTSCNHSFCRLCILKVFALQFSQQREQECPFCRQEVTFLTLLKVPTIELEERYWTIIYHRLVMTKMSQSLKRMELLNQIPRDDNSDFTFEDSDESTDSEEPLVFQSKPLAELALVVLPYLIYLVTSRLLSRLRGN